MKRVYSVRAGNRPFVSRQNVPQRLLTNEERFLTQQGLFNVDCLVEVAHVLGQRESYELLLQNMWLSVWFQVHCYQ